MVGSAEILQFIESSGGVSPFWLPRTTPVGMKFQPTSKGQHRTIVIGLIIAVVVVAAAILIYRYNKKKDREFEEKIKGLKPKKQPEPELQPEKSEKNVTE